MSDIADLVAVALDWFRWLEVPDCDEVVFTRSRKLCIRFFAAMDTFSKQKEFKCWLSTTSLNSSNQSNSNSKDVSLTFTFVSLLNTDITQIIWLDIQINVRKIKFSCLTFTLTTLEVTYSSNDGLWCTSVKTVLLQWLCQAKLKLFDWVIFESDYAITIISLRLAEYEIIKSKSMLCASCVNYQLIFGAPLNNYCYWSRSGFIRSWVVNNLDSMHKNHEGNILQPFILFF